MNGPFDGVLTHSDGVSREALPSAFAAALAAVQTRAWTQPLDAPAKPDEAARELFFTFAADTGVTYAGELAGLRSWSEAALAKTAALAALAKVARCAARLHARSVVHGDLRPEMIWVDAAGAPVLLVPAHATAPGATLRARLHPGGAPAAAVGFAAPEAVAAYEATPATDVYGLAAAVYATLTGYAPLGQVNLKPYPQGPAGVLAANVESALNQTPALRPTMDTLAASLAMAASATHSPDAPQASAYRNGPSGQWSAAEAAAARAQATSMSPVLVLVLFLGGLCAFVGAVLLVVAGWDVVGEFGRVALLAVLATVSAAAGTLAARRGLETGATVGRGLACLFATVAIAYTFALLHEPGRLVLLMALTAGSLLGGAAVERRGAPTGGAVLLALGSQLIWAVGAQVIDMTAPTDHRASVCLLAAIVSATTYGLALWRRSGPFGALAALDVAVFAAALGEYLKTGSVMGPPSYALMVAAGYALLATGATWRDAKSAALPFALGSAGAAGISVLAGLWVVSEHWMTHGALGVAWPFIVAGAAALLLRASSPLKPAAAFVAGSVVVFAPTVLALLRDDHAFTLGALGAGALVLLAALLWPALRERDDARAEAILAGLFGVMAVPGLRVLHAIESSRGAGWLEGHALDWATMSAASVGLLALSYAVTARVGRARYRLLEIAALGQFFGLLTFQVLATQADVQPAALALASAAALVTLGAITRRAAVLVISVAALLLHAWIQYFVRLEDVFPLSVRLVGFGVGLLVGGVLYEQQVRHRLALLRDWN